MEQMDHDKRPDGWLSLGDGGASGAAAPAGDASQQASSGDADAPQTPGGETVSRAELNKVVAQRQAAKEKARRLAEEVEALRAQLDGGDAGGGTDAPDAEDIAAIERRVRQPLEQHLQHLRGHKDALQQRLADLLRDQQLRSAAVRARAINPEQVVALLRDRVRLGETDDGEPALEFLDEAGQPLLDGERPVTDANRVVSDFLARPENANLVRPNVIPGSGARQAGGGGSAGEDLPRTRREFLALPSDERQAAAARMTRAQRDAILGRGGRDDGGYL